MQSKNQSIWELFSEEAGLVSPRDIKSTARGEPGRTAGETLELAESLDWKNKAFTIGQLKLAAKLGEMNFLYRACVEEQGNKRCWCWQKSKDKNRHVSIAYIIDLLIEEGNITEAQQAMTWPGAEYEKDIITAWIKREKWDIALTAIKICKVPLSESDFSSAFSSENFKIAQAMLKWENWYKFLATEEAQVTILQNLQIGENCLYAANFISVISAKKWSTDLILPFINTVGNMIRKSKEIFVSSNPLMYMLLTAEFAQALLLKKSIQKRRRIKSLIRDLMSYWLWFLKSLREHTSTLEYYLNQKDIMGRSWLVIIAKNKFIDLLDNSEITDVVWRLWTGVKESAGYLHSSSLMSSLSAANEDHAADEFTKGIDLNMPYVFQYRHWVQSASMRFKAQGISILLQAILYTSLIVVATTEKVQDDFTKHPTTEFLWRLSQIWICGIMIEQTMHLWFLYLTGKHVTLDFWKWIDFQLFIQMIIQMLGLHYMVCGDDKIIPINASLINTAQHGLMVVFIWIKFAMVLITLKQYGPLMFMLKRLTLSSVQFLFIFFWVTLLSVSIFSMIFNMERFDDRSKSFIYLYSTFLGAFDIEIFQGESYVYLGDTLFFFFLLITNVFCLRLIIAILAWDYLQNENDWRADYTAQLIENNEIWTWSKRYGILIFVPAPLSWISFLLAAFVFCCRNQKRANEICWKILFVFYVIPQLGIQLCISMLAAIPMYIKAFQIWPKTTQAKYVERINFIRMQTGFYRAESKKLEYKFKKTKYSILKALVWILWGLFYIPYVAIRDAVWFWALSYSDNYENEIIMTQSTQALGWVNPHNYEKVKKEDHHMDISMLKSFLESLKIFRVENHVTLEQYQSVWQANMQQDHIHDPETEHHIQHNFLWHVRSSVKHNTIDLKSLRRIFPAGTGVDQYLLNYARHLFLSARYQAFKLFHRRLNDVEVARKQWLPWELIRGETPKLRDMVMDLTQCSKDIFNMNMDYNLSELEAMNLTQNMYQALQEGTKDNITHQYSLKVIDLLAQQEEHKRQFSIHTQKTLPKIQRNGWSLNTWIKKASLEFVPIIEANRSKEIEYTGDIPQPDPELEDVLIYADDLNWQEVSKEHCRLPEF